MVDIRINNLPNDPAPLSTDVVPIDGLSTRKSNLTAIVEAGRPTASQAEAEAGTDPTKAMTPLRVAQAIAAQGSAAYVPLSRTLTAGAGLTGGGILNANRTFALNSASIASLLLADTSVQPARSINTGAGLLGGGNLSADRTLTVTPNLASLSGLSLVAGDIFYATGASSISRLPIGTVNQALTVAGGLPAWTSLAGTGNVVGPASATDGAIALYNGTTGKIIKDSTPSIIRDLLDTPSYVANRAAMKALDTTKDQWCMLLESGRQGSFYLTSYSSVSSQVALDTLEGLFVRSTFDPSMVWVRVYAVEILASWFGIVGSVVTTANGSLIDEGAAFQSMLNIVGFSGGNIVLPGNRAYRTNQGLFARRTSQEGSRGTFSYDSYFKDAITVNIISDGTAKIVAGASMASIFTFQFNSNTVGGVTNFTGPIFSHVDNIIFDGNSNAQYAIRGDFTPKLQVTRCRISGVTSACIEWLGSGQASIIENILQGPICISCDGGGGGDTYIGPNDYYFPVSGGTAVYIQNSGNIFVNGGTVNGEGLSNVYGVNINATAGNSVRHIKIIGMEWSGCLAGVVSTTATSAERIYGLYISGNHATSSAGVDRPAIHPGCVAQLANCDESTLIGNVSGGRALMTATAVPYFMTGCRSIKIIGANVSNYSTSALYLNGCDKISWIGGDVLDCAKAGSGGAVFDLDGGTTNSDINPTSVVATNASYGQIGIIERVGASGNSSDNVQLWSGIATPWFKAGATNGRFTRFSRTFAQGKIVQTAGGATLSLASNVASVSRASIGVTTVTFSTAHPDATSYLPSVTGIQCKCYIQSLTASTFQVVMLDLSDNPVDATFNFTVVSAL